jgi:hypothetical protein
MHRFQRLELSGNDKINVLWGELPPELLARVKEQVLNLQDPERYNSQLAGSIQKEFKLTHLPEVDQYIKDMYNAYSTKFDFRQGEPFEITQPWVNFQKKHEFNPMHNHGGDLSYNIWIQVPFLHAEERDIIKESSVNVNAQFQFTYTTDQQECGITSTSLPVDRTYEGKIILFPAWLLHSVYPFQTSDEYRISIAGNIAVGDKKQRIDNILGELESALRKAGFKE